jgi:hypothetical protein
VSLMDNEGVAKNYLFSVSSCSSRTAETIVMRLNILDVLRHICRKSCLSFIPSVCDLSISAKAAGQISVFNFDMENFRWEM